MSQRFLSTEWLWYFLALYAGFIWIPALCGAVRTPPNNPATVQAQSKFFQDFFSVQLSPYKIEFGHVCEDPNTWEQRYEKKDYKNHRDMGKVRWGDKKGGYGEHYWDLNHAGHNNDHDNDHYDNNDGSYHEEANDPYDEPSENSPTYGIEDYEKASYEDTSRNKRAYPKVKVERKTIQSYEPAQPKPKRNGEQLQDATHKIETQHEERNPHSAGQKQNHHQYKTEADEPKENQQFVLVVNHKDKDDDNRANQHVQRQPEPTSYVPYESGAGVRQPYQNEGATAVASGPRLFLEPSTGHVVDRATGQAYVLQPITKK